MPEPTRSPNRARWAQSIYRLTLRAYPARFRQAFADELSQAFRDMYEDAQARGSTAHIARLWLFALSDLVRSATQERIIAMRPIALIATLMTGAAFVVSLLASLNLYMLEDQNPLTLAAYRASPLLRLSYDAAYLSALVAGVMVCAVMARAFAPTGGAALVAVAALALVVVLGGFGGLLARAPLTFIPLFVAFVLLTLLCVFVAERATARLRQWLGARAAAVVGACVGAGVALVVNAAALAPHTIALNPVSHALYMQGQIPGTHLNSLLLGMALQLLLMCLLGLSVAVALRAPRRVMA
jgi:hypothetical protein